MLSGSCSLKSHTVFFPPPLLRKSGRHVFTSWFIKFFPTPNRGALMFASSVFWTVGASIEASLPWSVCQYTMQNDEVIWQVLKHKHCSFMTNFMPYRMYVYLDDTLYPVSAGLLLEFSRTSKIIW
ncbi:hypothetical protein L6452_18568 [Arctium lappa]|uniref:Uncharacterized protein n=1 Tax=Arctium lappa TaxID=4217 RepID=A0ACB9C6J7_ARCLA|nr:hypothetical protein L6452_18568 [Arctium lappa]